MQRGDGRELLCDSRFVKHQWKSTSKYFFILSCISSILSENNNTGGGDVSERSTLRKNLGLLNITSEGFGISKFNEILEVLSFII